METLPSPVAEQLATLIEAAVAGNSDRIAFLEENLDLTARQLMRLRMEDEGWSLLSGGKPEDGEGASLEQVKEISALLRPAVAESPLPKQANSLRASYVFSQKFIIPNLEGSVEIAAAPTPRRGPKTKGEKSDAALRAFAESRSAREYVLGKSAQTLISTACSTDGAYFLLGDDKTKEVHAVSIGTITGYTVNPDHPGEVWAYKRTWNPDPSNPKAEPISRWYYTDRYTGTRANSIGEDPNKVLVDRTKTIIDLSVNNQVDWPLGIPDLWAGHVWNRNYLASVKDGMEVSSLLAWLSAKVKTQSRSGSDAVGVKVAKDRKAGSVQTYGEGNAIDTYATSGKVYEYQQLNPIAAIYALAAGVSLVDLLSSPAASGSSYGAAQALTGGLRRAVEMRREHIAAWMERILEWATGSYTQVTPASIEEIDLYRDIQVLGIAWNTGLFHGDEIRPEMATRANITLKHTTPPEGVLLPNNKESWERGDIDPKEDPANAAAPPDQGQSNGGGGTDSGLANDNRDDQISK